MENELEQRIAEAIRDPKNMGEMENADAVGTVGNAQCGEMLRLWLKFKTAGGRKVIDRATFQSFGCETAIAVASLATELIRGKTPEEAIGMSSQELSGQLGPLPPMKIHCAQLVEGALRSALEADAKKECLAKEPASSAGSVQASSLLGNFTRDQDENVRVILLPKTG